MSLVVWSGPLQPKGAHGPCLVNGRGACGACHALHTNGVRAYRAIIRKRSQYTCKLCANCVENGQYGPTPEMGEAEMRAVIFAYTTFRDSDVITAIVDDGTSPHVGFYQADDSLHAPGTWSIRHPMSNFFKERLTLTTTHKAYVFSTSEQLIMLLKACFAGDGAAAHALGSCGGLCGSTAILIGRTVKGFDDHAWRAEVLHPRGIPYFVVRTKYDTCPPTSNVRHAVRNLAGCYIFECAPSDDVWGTGCSLDDFMSGHDPSGSNALGKAWTRITRRITHEHGI